MMNRKSLLMWLLIPLLSLQACSPAERSRLSGISYISNYKVTLYSGGKAVREWKTNGKVTSEKESDGYYFVDRESGKLIEVGGTIVIEQE